MKAVIIVGVMCGVVGCSGSADSPAASANGGSPTGAGARGGGAGTLGGGSGGTNTTGGGGSAGTAAEQPEALTLTLTVNGDGQVTSTPAGIICGTTCQASFPAGTEVTLTTKDQGGRFEGWAEACNGASTCTITLDADVEVGATFAPIEVGANAHGIAVTPDGTTGLVTLADSAGKLQPFSLADGSLGEAIAVGETPGALALTSDGSQALVNNRNSVSIVTLSTSNVFPVPSPCAGDTLYDIAAMPGGANAITTMFQGNCLTNTVAIVTPDGMGDQHPIPGTLASGVAVVPGGGSVLVGRGILGTSVTRVALPGGTVTNITDTSSSFGIAITPDGSEALIASGDGDTVKRVSLATNEVTGAIDFATNQDPHNIAITPDGALAVAVGSFEVGVLSLASGTVLERFSGGGRSVAITSDGKWALVTQGSTVRVYTLPQ